MARTLLLSGLLFIFLEGASSLLLAVHRTSRVTSEAFSRYDSLLGWTIRPSVDLPHHWAWRRGVRTNSLGLRGGAELETEEPIGRLRIVCAGDSFAFGAGVADDDAWCHRLEAMDPRLQPANLAVPGYGVDQAYLRYQRDAAALEHSVVLFTFTEGDFFRMRERTLYGYAKPVLRPAGQTLEITNIPPPRVLPAVQRTVADLARRLRVIELLNRAAARLRGAFTDADDMTTPELERVAAFVFRSVESLAGARDGGHALFVYLPTLHDVHRDAPWRERAAAILDSLGAPLIDLTDSLRSIPDLERPALFLPPEEPAGGHYSVAGNAWVARRLHRELMDRGIVPPDTAPAGPATPP